MSVDPQQALFKMIDERRDDLVELVQALIRFPTVNPPGEAYQPLLIEENMDSVKGEMRELLEQLVKDREGFTYDLRDVFEVQPTMADRNGPVARSTAAAIGRVLGREAEFVCSPGTYDQKHIDRIGKLRDCIAYGPGILDLAHQPDEYVLIDDMVNSAKVMAMAARSLLLGTA
jgi:succinyl-diaminopimelate desuccinylase